MSFPLMPIASIYSEPIEYYYGNVAFVASSSNTYTYNMAISNASVDRTVVIALAGSESANLTSYSIGGIPGTLLYSNTFHHFFSAKIPTGTTTNVSIAYDAVVTRVQATSWAVYNLLNDTPVSTNTTLGSGTFISTSINKAINGVVLTNLRYNTLVTSAATLSNVTTNQRSGSSGYPAQVVTGSTSCDNSDNMYITGTLVNTSPTSLSIAAIVLR